MGDLISIVIPIYNKEKYIDNCIKSVINQTYKNLMIILVDDGSSDNSYAICKKWEALDTRISFYYKKNGGVSSARNIGIKYAKGKYILFIDADDLLESNMVEVLYNNIISTKSNLSICSYYTNQNNKTNDTQNLIVFNRIEFYKNNKKYRGFCWNKLFELSKVKKIKFDEDVHYCEDLLFCIKYCENIDRICYTNLKLYNYVQNNDSVIKQDWNKRKISVLKAYNMIMHILKKYEFNTIKYFYIENFCFLNDIYHFYDKKYKKEVKQKYLYLIKHNMRESEKINLFIRYRLFGLYNFVRIVYHKARS